MLLPVNVFFLSRSFVFPYKEHTEKAHQVEYSNSHSLSHRLKCIIRA